MSGPLWKLGVAALGDLYRSGAVNPSVVLSAILDRIEHVNADINAFACLDIEGARNAASASDARWRGKSALGPLDGIPFTIKDNITVKGLPCAWGSELFRDFVPQDEEPVVTRLRCAGAVLLGKTNVSEFTIGRGTVSTSAFGTTRNPWNLALTTGASSGGGAAAVAAGIGPAALGTDGGGSIRRPASHCGVVGFKPSTGRVARHGGLPAILHDCEVIGPLARTVADVEIIFNEIAGPAPQDRLSWAFAREERVAPRIEDKHYRILYVPRFADGTVDPEIGASCAEAAAALGTLGHEVQQGPAPFDVGLYQKYWPVISQAGVNWILRGKAWRGRIGRHLEQLADRGQNLSALDYMDALQAFRTIQSQIGLCFERFDFLMTPAVGALPWTATEDGPPYERTFTGFVNVAGVPAIALPGQPSPAGLPIGFQLVARFGREAELLGLARQIETHFPWSDRWPPI